MASISSLISHSVAWLRFPILGWAIEPGDVVCFYMLTLHAGAPMNHPLFPLLIEA